MPGCLPARREGGAARTLAGRGQSNAGLLFAEPCLLDAAYHGFGQVHNRGWKYCSSCRPVGPIQGSPRRARYGIWSTITDFELEAPRGFGHRVACRLDGWGKIRMGRLDIQLRRLQVLPRVRREERAGGGGRGPEGVSGGASACGCGVRLGRDGGGVPAARPGGAGVRVFAPGQGVRGEAGREDCGVSAQAERQRVAAGSPYDLSFSTEVAEHVPEALADEFVKFMIGSGRDCVFTAAHPGQGGTGHINEQPQEYWIRKFEAMGRRHDRAASERIATCCGSAARTRGCTRT